MSSSSPSVKVVLGAMDFGRFATESASLSMVESFLAAGHCEVDTALAYAGGESESIIGRFPADIKRRLVLHTKVNPTISVKGQTGLTRENVLNQCNESLTSLQLTPSPASPPLDVLYLHRPDHKTEVLETLRGMQELFVQGKYRRLGLSNYSAWQVMDVYHLCEEHSFVKPTVYQVSTDCASRPPLHKADTLCGRCH
jgi:aflatoxin B1 aldehyde reductase